MNQFHILQMNDRNAYDKHKSRVKHPVITKKCKMMPNEDYFCVNVRKQF